MKTLMVFLLGMSSLFAAPTKTSLYSHGFNLISNGDFENVFTLEGELSSLCYKGSRYAAYKLIKKTIANYNYESFNIEKVKLKKAYIELTLSDHPDQEVPDRSWKEKVYRCR